MASLWPMTRGALAVTLTAAITLAGGCGGGGSAVDGNNAGVGKSRAHTQSVALSAASNNSAAALASPAVAGLSADDEAAIIARLDTWSYLAAWPDLMSAFGTNLAAAEAHRTTWGVSESRESMNATFDVDDYLASNPDVQALCPEGVSVDSRECAAQQFVTTGFRSGRNWTDLMSLSYIASYSDLTAALGDDAAAGAGHYAAYGIAEGRQISWNAVNWGAQYPYMNELFDQDYTAITRYYINNKGVPATANTHFLLINNRGICLTPSNWDANTPGNILESGACPNYWAQRWRINTVTGQISSDKAPTQCVTALNVITGGNLTLARCDASDLRQQWSLPKGNRIQSTQINDPEDTQLCAVANNIAYSPITLAACSDTDTTQDWTLKAVPL